MKITRYEQAKADTGEKKWGTAKPKVTLSIGKRINRYRIKCEIIRIEKQRQKSVI